MIRNYDLNNNLHKKTSFVKEGLSALFRRVKKASYLLLVKKVSYSNGFRNDKNNISVTVRVQRKGRQLPWRSFIIKTHSLLPV